MQADWKSDRWYIALAIIAGFALIAAVAAPMEGDLKRAVVLTLVGGVLIGLGEWQQHQLQTRLVPGMKITSYPRRFHIGGLLVELVGLLLAARGLCLLW